MNKFFEPRQVSPETVPLLPLDTRIYPFASLSPKFQRWEMCNHQVGLLKRAREREVTAVKDTKACNYYLR